jgi:hypothetical protein
VAASAPVTLSVWTPSTSPPASAPAQAATALGVSQRSAAGSREPNREIGNRNSVLNGR